jgi:hypothetical protein
MAPNADEANIILEHIRSRHETKTESCFRDWGLKNHRKEAARIGIWVEPKSAASFLHFSEPHAFSLHLTCYTILSLKDRCPQVPDTAILANTLGPAC